MSAKRPVGFRDPVLWLIVLGGLVGLAVAYALHRDAIPLLPVDLRVGPNEAAALARDFLRERGFDPGGFDSVTTFFVRRDELDYLHRLGGGSAVETARRRGAVLWYWRVRFYRPGDIREFEVWVGTDGRPVGFNYRAPEDEPGAQLGPADVVRLTRTALQDVTGPAGNWEPVEVIQQARPRRLDYRVTWEEQTPLFAEARRRVSFTVQGDRLAGIQPYLKVPEAWQRLRAGENQRGSTLASLGWTGAYFLGFAATALALARLGREPLPWRFAGVVAGGFLLISGVAALNGLPLAWADYDPATPPLTFLVGQVQGWAGVAGLEAAATFAAALAGPLLVRRAFPRTPNPAGQLFGPVTAGQVARWLLVGYGGAAAWLGYFAAYYWVGARYLGIWAPFEPPYRDIMNTALPVLFPVTLGLAAALAEESVFRLFALPLGTLVLRRLRLGPLAFPAALVAVSLLWGTLHATYPQQPFYVRAIEVGVGGLVSGLLFVRYGLVPVILIHYTGNAAIAGILFWLSGRPDLQASAVVAVGLPLLAAIRLAFRGPIDRPTAPTGPEPAALTEPAPVPVKAAGGGLRWLVLPAAAAILLVVALPPYPGQTLRIPVGPDQVVERAADLASGLGPDVSGWLTAISFVDRSDTAPSVYLIRQVGIPQAEAIFGREPLNFVWLVRFARPLEKEAVIVELGPDGEPVGFRHDLPEDAPARSLPPDAVQNVLQGILRAFRENPAGLRLIAQAQEQRPGRVDAVFLFERRTPLAPDAVVRVGIGLWGDQLGQFGRFLKVPEAFVRRLGSPDPVAAVFKGAAALVGLALGIWAAAVLVRRGLVRGLDVRPGLVAAGLLGLARLVEWVMRLRELYWSYPSTLDVPAFILWQVSSDLRALLLQAVGVFLGVTFIRLVAGSWAGAGRAWWAGPVGAGLVGLWYWVAQILQTLLLEPANHPPVTVIPAELLSRYIPALAAPASRLADYLLVATTVLAVIGLLRTRLRADGPVMAGVGLVTALVGAATAVEAPAALVQLFTFGLLGAALAWFCLRIAGPSLWTVTATLAGARLVADAYFLVNQPRLLFVLNGLLLFLVALVVLVAAGRPNLPVLRSD